MTDFHVITSTEQRLVMQTNEDGNVYQVWPAPSLSLPGGAAPAASHVAV